MAELDHLDLFSGIGGFSLASNLAGFTTKAFCEIDKSCRKILNKHWPETPVHKDIRQLNGNDYAGIRLITGGYPCQPFSVAGGQKAQNDHRHLWPEMRRIIAQAQPYEVICENVYGHITLGLDSVLHDLEALGYTCQPFVIPALAGGANHTRERVFIVAYSSSNGRYEGSSGGSDGKADDHCPKREIQGGNYEGCGSVWAGVEGYSLPTGRRGTEPPPLRVDDELPRRMDRNRMLGNAIDPMIAYQLLTALNMTRTQKCQH